MQTYDETLRAIERRDVTRRRFLIGASLLAAGAAVPFFLREKPTQIGDGEPESESASYMVDELLKRNPPMEQTRMIGERQVRGSVYLFERDSSIEAFFSSVGTDGLTKRREVFVYAPFTERKLREYEQRSSNPKDTLYLLNQQRNAYPQPITLETAIEDTILHEFGHIRCYELLGDVPTIKSEYERRAIMEEAFAYFIVMAQGKEPILALDNLMEMMVRERREIAIATVGRIHQVRPLDQNPISEKELRNVAQRILDEDYAELVK